MINYLIGGIAGFALGWYYFKPATSSSGAVFSTFENFYQPQARFLAPAGALPSPVKFRRIGTGVRRYVAYR